MTKSECEEQVWPHNHRCRYTHGFFCEDCRTFYAKESPTYRRYELPSSLWMVIHNIGVDFSRTGFEIPAEVDGLCYVLDNVKEMNEEDLERTISNAISYIHECKRKTTDAQVLIK